MMTKVDPDFSNTFVAVIKNIVLMLAATMLMYSQAVSAKADKSTLNGEYRLGPEDQIEISVWKEDDLNRTVTVRPDGRISFPLAGELMVSGKTVNEVQREISKRIKKYIPEAVTSVSVMKVASYRIYVLGKVNSPGEYVLGTYVDVIQALSLADGLTPYASENNIKIIRRGDGEEKVFEFAYKETKEGKNLQQNIMLETGDVVVVP